MNLWSPLSRRRSVRLSVVVCTIGIVLGSVVGANPALSPRISEAMMGSVDPSIADANTVPAKETHCTLHSGAEDSTYASFPSVARTPDGRVIAVWRAAPQHQYGQASVMYAETSKPLQGCQWSAPRALYTETRAGYTISVGGVSVTPRGTIVIGMVRYRTPSPSAARDFRALALRTEDGGNTWGAPESVATGFAGQAYPSSVATLPDGSLLMAAYGTHAVSDYRLWGVRLLRSRDEGRTWQYQGYIDRTADGVTLTEPQLLAVGEQVSVALRSDTPTPRLSLATSYDEGSSFTPLHTIREGVSGMPTLGTLPGERYAIAYRDLSNAHQLRYAVSNDLHTWGPGIDPTSQGQMGRMVYAGFASLGEKGTVMVYALENPEGDAGGWASVYSTVIQ